MFNNYIIESEDAVAGIVVREGTRFRFYSASRAFDSLEGQLFASPRDAERTALARIGPNKSTNAFVRRVERRREASLSSTAFR